MTRSSRQSKHHLLVSCSSADHYINGVRIGCAWNSKLSSATILVLSFFLLVSPQYPKQKRAQPGMLSSQCSMTGLTLSCSRAALEGSGGFLAENALGDLGGTCRWRLVESATEVSHRSRLCVALRHPDLELERAPLAGIMDDGLDPSSILQLSFWQPMAQRTKGLPKLSVWYCRWALLDVGPHKIIL